MALSQILTDGSETGLTAAEKINAAFVAVDNLVAPSDYEDFVPQTVAPAYSEGRMYYDDTLKTMIVNTGNEGVDLFIGQKMIIRAYNNSGATIIKGTPCTYTGIDSTTKLPTITPAQADSYANSIVLGVTPTDIPNNTACCLVKEGIITGVDTSGLPVGVPIYLSDTVPGGLTATAPDIVTQVGGVFVSDVSSGILYVELKVNEELPKVFGYLKEQSSATYNLTSTPQNIDGYTSSDNIVSTVNTTNGIITIPNTGSYKATISGDFSFASSLSTRSIYVEVHNLTTASEIYHHVVSIPREATEDAIAFAVPFTATAGDQIVARIYSDPDLTVDIDHINFLIESLRIR